MQGRKTPSNTKHRSAVILAFAAATVLALLAPAKAGADWETDSTVAQACYGAIWQTLPQTSSAMAFWTLSDARMKDKVTTVEGPRALEIVHALRGVRYRWKQTETDSYGFIAQEVEQVMPEAVHTDPQSGMKSVYYDQVIPVLVEALKAHRDQLNAMDEQLDEIEARTEALESRVNAYEGSGAEINPR
jgi:hypothetical protein